MIHNDCLCLKSWLDGIQCLKIKKLLTGTLVAIPTAAGLLPLERTKEWKDPPLRVSQFAGQSYWQFVKKLDNADARYVFFQVCTPNSSGLGLTKLVFFGWYIGDYTFMCTENRFSILQVFHWVSLQNDFICTFMTRQLMKLCVRTSNADISVPCVRPNMK